LLPTRESVGAPAAWHLRECGKRGAVVVQRDDRDADADRAGNVAQRSRLVAVNRP
jgi:hypothetical protein